MRRILIIVTIILTALGCANKNNIFKDPSTQKGASKETFLYKVNKKEVNLPVFFRLPQDKKNISLTFEKIGSSSVPVILNNDINGWNAFSSKPLSANGADFGLIIDFAGGGVYEMPQDDVRTYLSKFAPQDAFILKELLPGKNNKGFTKMIAVDASALYNKEELNHLVLLNDLDLANQSQNMYSYQSEIQDTPKVEGDKTFNKINKNAVVLDRPLITAATNGQYDRLLKLLDNNANINELNPETLDNALIAAIGNGDEDIANRASTLYKQCTGKSIHEDIREHGRDSFTQGFLQTLTFGFADGKTAEENISQLTGQPVGRSENALKFAGNVAGGAVVGGGILASAGLIWKGIKTGAKCKTFWGILAGAAVGTMAALGLTKN